METSFLPFFNEGSGKENFAFAPPTFLADSISENGADTPSGEDAPNFRFGDFKSFILENTEQRSFFDGSPAIGDVWIDGFTNGISSADEPDGEIAIDGSEWHTILVSGFRNGGGGITGVLTPFHWKSFR